MRARMLHAWTTGIALALVGMVCGLAVMAVAVSADDGDMTEGGCPAATATPTATATEEATEEASAARVLTALQSTADEGGSAACPGDEEQEEEAPGNSGAAHSCPFGGEEGESGESYRNHGACVSEAAHRRNEERQAARRGTPRPTSTPTATGTPTAAPTGTSSAAAAGTAGSGHGRPDHRDNGDNGRHGNGGGHGRR